MAARLAPVISPLLSSARVKPDLEPVSILHRVPIFPLAETVLFPGTVIPMHISEERYKTLVADALASDETIALVKFQDPTIENPNGPLCEIGCLGQIIHAEKLPDNHYNILLQGMQRIRLLEELPSERVYRRFRAQLIPHPSQAALQAAHHQLRDLYSCMLSLRACVEASDQQLAEVLRATSDPLELTDILCAVLISDTQTQQQLLAEANLTGRLDVLLHAMINAMVQQGAPPLEASAN